MQMNFKLNKAGVSLIAVLLFMLVATIAATATWKWLSSEGKSSASRMLKREAYQSSVAGIENARSWMTFHANDVGAIIKQYLDDPQRKAINLDEQVQPFQRAGQSYHVWLTGVNVENATYKIKIYSEGRARNDTRHSQVAIFNVDGLYRIDIPQEVVRRAIPFDYNYFGGTTINHGNVFAKSMLVNGDLLNGNPASIDDNLVVTGNFKVSGNSIAVNGTACVGGYLDADNGLVGNNFYVHGDLRNLKIRPLTENRGGVPVALGNSIYGNLYVNGDITAANGNQVIDGNLTLNGTWTTNMNGYDAGVKGNLCVGNAGQIVFPSLSREFKGGASVWMESTYPLWTGSDNYDKYNRIVMGTRGNDVYINNAHPYSDYSSIRKVFTEKGGTYFGPVTTDNKYRWGRGVAKDEDETYRDVFRDRQTKPGLAFLYNWPSSTNLVEFGPLEGTLQGYKLNGQRFWNPEVDNSFVRVNASSTEVTGSPYCGPSSGTGPAANSWNGFGVWFGWGGFTPTGPDQKKWARPSCGVTPWFKVNGNLKTTMPENKPDDLTCAESVKEHCDELWQPTEGCGSTNFLVSDPLRTGISYFENYANNHTCVSTLVTSTDINNFDFGQFSTCYENAVKHDDNAANTEKWLYNGYLVVKITNRNIFKSPKNVPLQGKFIFIFENDLGQSMNLPETADDGSYVFLYFKDGLGGSSEIRPVVNGSDNYNYFIYSKNDIHNVLFNNSVIKGSIYAAVLDEATGEKVCAKAEELTFNNGMEFNQELLEDLTEAGILCPNDGSACGGAAGEAVDVEDDDVGAEAADIKDQYYISMAPQLNIHVESMYETEERRPSVDATANEVQPSYIILPRVIYLPSDPYGTLADYYNVVPLNKSTLTKDAVVNSVACSGAGPLHTTGKLYDGASLSRGIYKCEARPAGQSVMPFWVVVSGNLRGAGEISFVDPSQIFGATETKAVNIMVSPHADPLDVKVNCPAVPNGQWNYNPELSEYYVSKTGTECVFRIPVNAEFGSYKLFDVSTENATEGLLTFTLKAGEGYSLGNPVFTDLLVSSTAKINRVEVSDDDINAYCDAHAGVCPTDKTHWPDCDYNGLWVDAEGGSIVTEDQNESWAVSLGGGGTVSLVDRSPAGKCVVIIPSTGSSMERTAMNANETYSLKATAKAVTRTVKIVYAGDVSAATGSSSVPYVNYTVGGVTTPCAYTGLGEGHACTVSVFDGEEISFSIELENTTVNDDFSFWQCVGTSCPTDAPVRASAYESFSLKDDQTTMYVHFGENDKHCFVDEFKSNNVGCSASNDTYCIDKCNVAGKDVCESATDEGEFTSSKWRLLSGGLSNIDAYAGHISIKNLRGVTRGVNNKGNAVKVISTVNAGYRGILKTQFRMPQATSSYGKSSENIAKSGFILRANSIASEYLMLNVFVNVDGHLEAQICTDAGSCLNGEFLRNNLPVSVSTASLVTMSAALNTENDLAITAFTGTDYYGSPAEYTCSFNLASLSTNYADFGHEYVGFSLADPNFKLYAIGWESIDYNSDCWDTPPSVKCSFAAVAQDGVIPLGTEVKPWVGYSAWFSTSEDCSPVYYYYNGSDASSYCNTSSETGVLQCSRYKFESEGAGQHGYGNDVKTAKAAFACRNATVEANNWAMLSQTAAERAHCGVFWTGAFSECDANSTLISSDVVLSPDEQYTEMAVVQGNRYNLRGAQLKVELDNPDNNEVELVLVSKHDYNDGDAAWGDACGMTETEESCRLKMFMSRSVKITGNQAVFDVVLDLANGADGFDPEKVRNVILKNHGMTPVTVKSVIAMCKHAVGITSCKAEYKDADGAWLVTGYVNNLASITAITTNKKIETITVGEGDNYGCMENPNGSTCDKGTTIAGTVTQSIPDNPYVYPGKSYKFTMSISNKADKTITETKDCEVTPDPIGAITSECRVNTSSVQTGKGMPQFQFTLNGCHKDGCPYDIMVDGTKYGSTGNAKSGESVKITPAMNTATIPLAVQSHTIRVVSPNDDESGRPLFDCSASFNVTSEINSGDELKTTCEFDQVSYGPGAQAKFTFVVNNNSGVNITGRNYKLTLPDGSEKTGSTGTGANQTVTFAAPNVGGSAILYVWDVDRYKESCSATLGVESVSPTSCTRVNNGYTFRAHFDQICGNGECPWELKKTVGEADPTTVSSGVVDRYDVDININGEGTYNLWVNGVKQTDCEVTIAPAGSDVSATCSFESNGSPVTNISSGFPYLNFKMTNIVGGTAMGPQTMTLKSNGEYVTTVSASVGVQGSPQTGGKSNVAAPDEAGSYVYTVEYNGYTICTTDPLVVGDALSCSVTNDSPAANTTFGFTVSTSSGNCWSCTMYNDNSSETNWALQNGVTSKTWNSLTSTGSPQHLSATCTCDNTLVSCEKWINYTLTTPTIGCPSNAIEYTTDAVVRFTPTSLTGCNIGCSYRILDKDNGNAVLVNHTSKNYTSAVAMNGFAGSTEDGTSGHYTVVVENTYTGTNSASCNFSVTYDATVPVRITTKNEETNVPCGKKVAVNMPLNAYSAVTLVCSGNFDKTVGSVSKNQHESVQIVACDNYSSGTATTCSEEFETSCDEGNRLVCTAY